MATRSPFYRRKPRPRHTDEHRGTSAAPRGGSALETAAPRTAFPGSGPGLQAPLQCRPKADHTLGPGILPGTRWPLCSLGSDTANTSLQGPQGQWGLLSSRGGSLCRQLSSEVTIRPGLPVQDATAGGPQALQVPSRGPVHLKFPKQRAQLGVQPMGAVTQKRAVAQPPPSAGN